jgi:hypothetical protein
MAARVTTDTCEQEIAAQSRYMAARVTRGPMLGQIERLDAFRSCCVVCGNVRQRQALRPLRSLRTKVSKAYVSCLPRRHLRRIHGRAWLPSVCASALRSGAQSVAPERRGVSEKSYRWRFVLIRGCGVVPACVVHVPVPQASVRFHLCFEAIGGTKHTRMITN